MANSPLPNTSASVGAITAYQPNGSSSPLYSAANFLPLSLAMAPGGCGSFGGDLIVPNTTYNPTTGILAIDSYGKTSTPVSGLTVVTRGAAFTPSGFGSLGGNLFFTSGQSSNVYVRDGSGTYSLFTTLPLTPPGGLRQAGFAPAGFGNFGGDLIVAVPLTGVDPRGTYFPANAEMLFANAGGVYAAISADIEELPEPAACRGRPAAFALWGYLGMLRRTLR